MTPRSCQWVILVLEDHIAAKKPPARGSEGRHRMLTVDELKALERQAEELTRALTAITPQLEAVRKAIAENAPLAQEYQRTIAKLKPMFDEIERSAAAARKLVGKPNPLKVAGNALGKPAGKRK